MLFTLPANPVSCIIIPTPRLANGLSLSSGCAGDDGTENGIGFKDGEPESLDDGSGARVVPLNRVECRRDRSCVTLALVDLNTDERIVNALCRGPTYVTTSSVLLLFCRLILNFAQPRQKFSPKRIKRRLLVKDIENRSLADVHMSVCILGR